MKIHPLNNQILIKQIEKTKQISNNIIIPNTTKKKPQETKIITINPNHHNNDKNLITLDVQPNQHILINKFTNNKIEINKKKVHHSKQRQHSKYPKIVLPKQK